MKNTHGLLTAILVVTSLFGVACGASSQEPNGPPEQGSNGPPEQGSNVPPRDPQPGEKIVVGNDPCQTDADCVPVCGCHASSCIAKANATACDPNRMCTAHCQPGTMDCGGGCLCQGGKCAARLVNAP